MASFEPFCLLICLPGWPMSLARLLLMTTLIPCAVTGLSCVQCVSVDILSCLHGDMSSMPCRGKDNDSKYCYKSVGSQVYGDGHFVARGCSRTLQTNCTKTLVYDHIYNVCHNSCVHDGCNRAQPYTVANINYLILTLLVLLVALFHNHWMN